MSGSATTGVATSLSAMVLIFFSCLLLWIAMVGSLDAQELLAGIVVAATVTLLFYPRLSIFNGFRLTILIPWHILRYLFDFIIALIVANFDMARRVLSPSLPIRPEMVEVKTALQSELGRLLLANTITLTPGTLSVDFEGDLLLVHWVYCPPGIDAEQKTQMIAGRFEQLLGRFLK